MSLRTIRCVTKNCKRDWQIVHQPWCSERVSGQYSDAWRKISFRPAKLFGTKRVSYHEERKFWSLLSKIVNEAVSGVLWYDSHVHEPRTMFNSFASEWGNLWHLGLGRESGWPGVIFSVSSIIKSSSGSCCNGCDRVP